MAEMVPQEPAALVRHIAETYGLTEEQALEVAREVYETAKQQQNTRARHAREANARFAADFGFSREGVRKFAYLGKVKVELGCDTEELLRRFPALRTAKSTSARYDILRGDDRRPLYAKLPPDVHDAFSAECRQRGITKATLLEEILRDRYE
jgi:hypothetical protein